MCIGSGGGGSTKVVQAPVETIATPTIANANVQKAGSDARRQASAAANQNIKTTANGLNDFASTSKKKLLGE
jgi:hypothetical protein